MTLLFLACPQPERAELEQTLAATGTALAEADNAQDAVAWLAANDAALVVLDLACPDAIAWLDEILAAHPGARVVAVAPDAQGLPAGSPLRARVLDVLARPLTAHDVAVTLARLRLMEVAGLSSLPSAPVVTHGLLGRSPRMREVIALIEKAASARGGVLITGERGAGRELIAHAIHECSPRAAGPFVTVTCSHVPPHEMDAALFGVPDQGHRGPHSARLSHETLHPGGFLHHAMGGTVLFTDLAEMPDRVQSKLARLFRDGEFLLSGRGRPQAIAFRPIAVAGPDVDADVREGRVRVDLFRRMSGTHIDVPSLRDRREDIPALAAHFVEQASLQMGAAAKPFTPSALAVLSALPWKGNIRELRGSVETLALKAQGPNIELDDVLAQVRLEGGPSPVTLVGMMGPLKKARVHFEREYIAAVLEHHHGRVPEAARTLGIQRTNLYRKLRSLHLPRASAAAERASG